MSTSQARGFAGAAAMAAAAMIASCSGEAPLELCGEIPTGGCPIGRGGTCADATCTGVYDCLEGKWVETEACSAATTSSSGATSSSSTTGSGMCTPVTLDHSMETTGCKPDLENPPDCPSSAAETCAPCLTGCTDFFMCETTGWTDVAYCTDDGQLVVATQQ